MLVEKQVDNGITLSDLHNIQQRFCNDQFSGMAEFISDLEQTGHQVRTRVDSDDKVNAVFFMHEHGRDELRRLPESVIIDATYKTNSHRMVLLNIVVAGTVASEYRRSQLATIHVAGCWMRKETTESYEWAMKQLRSIAWPSGTDPSLLPDNFVTDKDQALMNAIKVVFPESRHILCYVHIVHNFLKRLIKNMSKKVQLGNLILNFLMSKDNLFLHCSSL